MNNTNLRMNFVENTVTLIDYSNVTQCDLETKSILKPPKVRAPLQEVDLGIIKQIDRDYIRTRKVSFAGVNKIKPFHSHAESLNICSTPAYEETVSLSSDSSSAHVSGSVICGNSIVINEDDCELLNDTMDLTGTIDESHNNNLFAFPEQKRCAKENTNLLNSCSANTCGNTVSFNVMEKKEVITQEKPFYDDSSMMEITNVIPSNVAASLTRQNHNDCPRQSFCMEFTETVHINYNMNNPRTNGITSKPGNNFITEQIPLIGASNVNASGSPVIDHPPQKLQASDLMDLDESVISEHSDNHVNNSNEKRNILKRDKLSREDYSNDLFVTNTETADGNLASRTCNNSVENESPCPATLSRFEGTAPGNDNINAFIDKYTSDLMSKEHGQVFPESLLSHTIINKQCGKTNPSPSELTKPANAMQSQIQDDSFSMELTEAIPSKGLPRMSLNCNNQSVQMGLTEAFVVQSKGLPRMSSNCNNQSAQMELTEAFAIPPKGLSRMISNCNNQSAQMELTEAFTIPSQGLPRMSSNCNNQSAQMELTEAFAVPPKGLPRMSSNCNNQSAQMELTEAFAIPPKGLPIMSLNCNNQSAQMELTEAFAIPPKGLPRMSSNCNNQSAQMELTEAFAVPPKGLPRMSSNFNNQSAQMELTEAITFPVHSTGQFNRNDDDLMDFTEALPRQFHDQKPVTDTVSLKFNSKQANDKIPRVDVSKHGFSSNPSHFTNPCDTSQMDFTEAIPHKLQTLFQTEKPARTHLTDGISNENLNSIRFDDTTALQMSKTIPSQPQNISKVVVPDVQGGGFQINDNIKMFCNKTPEDYNSHTLNTSQMEITEVIPIQNFKTTSVSHIQKRLTFSMVDTTEIELTEVVPNSHNFVSLYDVRPEAIEDIKENLNPTSFKMPTEMYPEINKGLSNFASEKAEETLENNFKLPTDFQLIDEKLVEDSHLKEPHSSKEDSVRQELSVPLLQEHNEEKELSTSREKMPHQFKEIRIDSEKVDSIGTETSIKEMTFCQKNESENIEMPLPVREEEKDLNKSKEIISKHVECITEEITTTFSNQKIDEVEVTKLNKSDPLETNSPKISVIEDIKYQCQNMSAMSIDDSFSEEQQVNAQDLHKSIESGARQEDENMDVDKVQQVANDLATSSVIPKKTIDSENTSSFVNEKNFPCEVQSRKHKDVVHNLQLNYPEPNLEIMKSCASHESQPENIVHSEISKSSESSALSKQKITEPPVICNEHPWIILTKIRSFMFEINFSFVSATRWKYKFPWPISIIIDIPLSPASLQTKLENIVISTNTKRKDPVGVLVDYCIKKNSILYLSENWLRSQCKTIKVLLTAIKLVETEYSKFEEIVAIMKNFKFPFTVEENRIYFEVINMKYLFHVEILITVTNYKLSSKDIKIKTHIGKVSEKDILNLFDSLEYNSKILINFVKGIHNIKNKS